MCCLILMRFVGKLIFLQMSRTVYLQVKMQGLDTLNPILTIGNRLKLIGKYEETIGTCLIFSENEKPSSVCEGSESVEANLSRGTLEADHNQNPSKLIMPVTSLHKILKFRLLPEADEQDLTGKPPDASSQKEHL